VRILTGKSLAVSLVIRYDFISLVNLRTSTLSLGLSMLIPVFALSSPNASDGRNEARTGAYTAFSADDFDWRVVVQSLSVAAGLPGEQGIKAMLEGSKVLRAYVAEDIRDNCRRKNPCPPTEAGPGLEGEVSKRIDQIVQEGVIHRKKAIVVDYSLPRRPFPFSEIVALKSEKRQDAYLILDFSDRSYTAAQLQSKYGAPYDTNVFQWFSVFEYRLDSPRYTSKAVFEVDPTDGAVMKVAISLKARKHR
jgi:hypothetical protein